MILQKCSALEKLLNWECENSQELPHYSEGEREQIQDYFLTQVATILSLLEKPYIKKIDATAINHLRNSAISLGFQAGRYTQEDAALFSQFLLQTLLFQKQHVGEYVLNVELNGIKEGAKIQELIPKNPPQNPSKILEICLLRYGHRNEATYSKKISTSIIPNEILTLHDNNSKTHLHYILKAIIIHDDFHTNSLRRGHYFTYLPQHEKEEEEVWVLCDDEKVLAIDNHKKQKAYSNACKNGYLLYYEIE